MVNTAKCVRAGGVLIVALLLVMLGCTTTGPGGKESLILIPTSQEVAIGRGMAEQVRQQEQILQDSVWQAYLDSIGQSIVKVSDRSGLEYHFTVIESDQVNAFAAPGGFIYFYTGMLKYMDTEAELAAVVAHEISHVVARHSIQRVQKAMGAALAYDLIFGEEGASKATNVAINIGMSLAFAGYSREAEREADSYGIHYMVKAGYHPQGAVSMFETLAELGGAEYDNVFEGLTASHPETQERIKNARQQIEEMKPLSDGLVVGRDQYQQMLSRLQ
jgi:predicted Zn-dependent protease